MLSAHYLRCSCLPFPVRKTKRLKLQTKAELLASLTAKDWKLNAAPDDEDETDESCQNSSPIYSDNVYTFRFGGDFEFSNGTITEIENCDDCSCSDAVDLVGGWEIFSNGDSLSVIATGKIVDDVIIPFTEEETFIRAKIKSLSATELVLDVDGETGTFTVID